MNIEQSGTPVCGHFVKKPIKVFAAQWFKNGDHPGDYANATDITRGGKIIKHSAEESARLGLEGQVVGHYYFNADGTPAQGHEICEQCGRPSREHGFIQTLEGGHRVCPGDWIITGIQGEHYPCKPSIFAATYDAVGVDGVTDPLPPVAADGAEKVVTAGHSGR